MDKSNPFFHTPRQRPLALRQAPGSTPEIPQRYEMGREGKGAKQEEEEDFFPLQYFPALVCVGADKTGRQAGGRKRYLSLRVVIGASSYTRRS